MRIHWDLPSDQAGMSKKINARAKALRWELENSARPNDVALYRGSHQPPSGLASWSDDPEVAQWWAKQNGGKVWTLAPGEAQGLRIADYGTGSGLDEIEKEWIINHQRVAKTAATTPWGQDFDEWAETRPPYKGGGHQLGYNPNVHSEGKGFVLDNGDVWTWPTHELRPLHHEYDYRVQKQGLKQAQKSAFHIQNGQVKTYGEGRDASRYADQILAADSRLSFVPQDAEWSFAA